MRVRLSQETLAVLDCGSMPMTASDMGKKGGKAKSRVKVAAARKNIIKALKALRKKRLILSA